MAEASDILIELRALMQSSGKNQRRLAREAALSREMVRRTVLDEREPTITEAFSILRACGAEPVEWLVRLLDPEEKADIERDRKLLAALRRHLGNRQKREILAALIASWEDDRVAAPRGRNSR